MGMYLMRQIGRDGNYHSDLSDFMVFLDWKELPGTGRCPTALSPHHPRRRRARLVAFVFGLLRLRSRIKGVYFSITQALTLRRHAAVLPQRNRLWRQQRLYRFQAHPQPIAT